MMRRLTPYVSVLGFALYGAMAYAGPPVDGALEKQATNWHAIVMFCLLLR